MNITLKAKLIFLKDLSATDKGIRDCFQANALDYLIKVGTTCPHKTALINNLYDIAKKF